MSISCKSEKTPFNIKLIELKKFKKIVIMDYYSLLGTNIVFFNYI